MRRILTFGLLMSVAGGVRAESRCSAKGVMGGKAFSMTHCAISYYDDQHSVTIWFSEAPISAEEEKAFQLSSYASDQDAKGKFRTLMHLAFCPGGGAPVPRPAAVKSVEIGMNNAESPLLGRQWVLDPSKDKHIRFEKLSGDLKLGGRLAGRVTGGKTREEDSQGAYSWQIDFDLPLPAKSAAAGAGCGS